MVSFDENNLKIEEISLKICFLHFWGYKFNGEVNYEKFEFFYHNKINSIEI